MYGNRHDNLASYIIYGRVPGANQHRVPKSTGLIKQADWCQQAFLQEELQVLYVPIKGSVYGFRIDDGERIYNWEGLHKQLVTAVVHHPGPITSSQAHMI